MSKKKPGATQVTVTPENIEHYLGVRRFDFGRA